MGRLAVCADHRGLGAAIPTDAGEGATMKKLSLSQLQRINKAGAVLTLVTVLAGIFWAFPIYWVLATTFKPEQDIVQPGLELWPRHFTAEAYTHVIFETKLGLWYLNSLITSLSVTVLVLVMSAGAGYAISQLNFPGRRILWWLILASFMVPIPALIVNHFVLMAQMNLLNTLTGVVLPQLIAPVTVMIYKQFFDSVPKDFREAAVMDGATQWQLLFRLYLPMNWGITTALGIITFIGAWNVFLWPFLAVSTQDKMNVTVGITQVYDAFGVKYARDLASAVLAGLPVAVVYLLFQRRVTQAIMLTAGIKG
jgi:multiple sugar transport system permease protein